VDAPPPPPPPKILVVEGDSRLRLGLRQLLERGRYAVLEAASGTEAVGLAEKHQPNLILLDLGLPDGDGLRVAQELKRRAMTSKIPIAILTGEWVNGPRAEILGRICVGTIPKPVTAERLERDVSILLSMRQRRSPRKFPRYSVEIPGWYRVQSAEEAADAEFRLGMVKTISEGGFMLELSDGVAEQTFLDLRLMIPTGEITATGRVVYSQQPQGELIGDGSVQHGIQLVHINPKEMAHLKQLIRDTASPKA
jgi:CheY-like chemotaxis protein